MAHSDSGCVPTAIKQSRDALESMNDSLKNISDGSKQLSTNLTDVKNSMEDLLQNSNECASEPAKDICDNIRSELSNLGSNLDANQVSGHELAAARRTSGGQVGLRQGPPIWCTGAWNGKQ